MTVTALEAHIQVLQGVQKIAGYSQDMFNPEEIDLQLNRHQNRVIDEIVNKTFQDVEVATDYIRPLIIKNYPLNFFRSNQETEAVYGVFPGNYLNLVNSRSIVIRSTDSRYCNDLTSFKVPTSKNLYRAYMKIPVTPVTAPPYYYNMRLVLTTGSGDVIILQAPPELYLSSSKSVFSIINYILDYNDYSNLDVYWEQYVLTNLPNTLIFATNNNTYAKISIQFYKPDTSLEVSADFNFLTDVYLDNMLNLSTAIPGYVATSAGNTIVELDEFYLQQQNYLYRSKPTQPKAVIYSNRLRAYESRNFIISELYIDYIRKPRHVSLALSQGLELGGNGPQIVIDRVIEYLKLAIENPAYQAYITDNKRNQI